MAEGNGIMEKRLFQAFDLHRFAPNGRLQRVIDKTHARLTVRELSDDELELVAAAGAPEPRPTGARELTK